MAAETDNWLNIQDHGIQSAFIQVKHPEMKPAETDPLLLSGTLVLSDLDDSPIPGSKKAIVELLTRKYHIDDPADLDSLPSYYYRFQEFPWEKYGTNASAVTRDIIAFFADPKTYLNSVFSHDAHQAYKKMEDMGAQLVFHTGRRAEDGNTDRHHALHSMTQRNLHQSGFNFNELHTLAESLVMGPKLPKALTGGNGSGEIFKYGSLDLKMNNAKWYRDVLGYRVVLIDDHLEICLKASQMGFPSVLLAQSHNYPHHNEFQVVDDTVLVPNLIYVTNDFAQLPSKIVQLQKDTLQDEFASGFTPYHISTWEDHASI